jgi:hypothetical protein
MEYYYSNEDTPTYIRVCDWLEDTINDKEYRSERIDSWTPPHIALEPNQWEERLSGKYNQAMASENPNAVTYAPDHDEYIDEKSKLNYADEKEIQSIMNRIENALRQADAM